MSSATFITAWRKLPIGRRVLALINTENAFMERVKCVDSVPLIFLVDVPAFFSRPLLMRNIPFSPRGSPPFPGEPSAAESERPMQGARTCAPGFKRRLSKTPEAAKVTASSGFIRHVYFVKWSRGGERSWSFNSFQDYLFYPVMRTGNKDTNKCKDVD